MLSSEQLKQQTTNCTLHGRFNDDCRVVLCCADTACKATQMTFKELYDDLAQYITDVDQRWKHVMRVKRYHTDDNGLGGYGGDQCYLEGQSANRCCFVYNPLEIM